MVVWNGFGGSNRSINYENKSFVAHAGSLNLFIDLFIETGVVGLLLLAFAVMMLWRHSGIRYSAGRPQTAISWSWA